MPLTQYEIDGTWTSVVDGESFLHTVAQETGVTLDVIGQSVEGRDLIRITMGAGTRTLLITSGVHGIEPASRESILMKLRDMAYNSDGKYTSFLVDHQIMFIPTVNPDRMHLTYNNADDIDINRGAYPLNSPEVRAFEKTFHEVLPDMHVDFHEMSGSTNAISFVRAMHLDPNSDLTVRNTINTAIDYVMSQLTAKGHTTSFYPDNFTGFGSLTSGNGILGFITFTAETRWDAVPADRVRLQKEAFELSLTWFQQNHALINQTRTAFINGMLNPGDDFVLLNGLQKGREYYNSAVKVPIKVPEAYQLDNPSSFDLWKNTYKITVSPDGTVPIKQPSGRMLPHLLDPQSDIKVTTATRIEPTDPPDPPEPELTNGRWTKVLYDEWRDVFIRYM